MFSFSRQHMHTLWGRLYPRKPRHPLVRLMMGLLGVAVLALLVVFGLFVGAAMLAVTAGWRIWSRLSGPDAAPAMARPAEPGVIEGEYAIVRKPRDPLAQH